MTHADFRTKVFEIQSDAVTRPVSPPPVVKCTGRADCMCITERYILGLHQSAERPTKEPA